MTLGAFGEFPTSPLLFPFLLLCLALALASAISSPRFRLSASAFTAFRTGPELCEFKEKTNEGRQCTVPVYVFSLFKKPIPDRWNFPPHWKVILSIGEPEPAWDTEDSTLGTLQSRGTQGGASFVEVSSSWTWRRDSPTAFLSSQLRSFSHLELKQRTIVQLNLLARRIKY